MQEEEGYARLSVRLCESLNHTLSELSKGKQPSVFSHFKLPISRPPTKALTLLRDATKAGLATLINASPDYETYSLGVTPTLQALNVDPQWWVGLSRAEMRAGMWATPAEIKKAQKEIDKKAGKKGPRSKTKKLEAAMIDSKLAEGLKRQTLNLPMEGQLKTTKRKHPGKQRENSELPKASGARTRKKKTGQGDIDGQAVVLV
ncbi:hypothetical protein DM02DRAFT_706338 [Periconia macrospinosa]|uniref:Uncharacterized protein n=1 Tax=Periconia macrospinosa TaxID=97972 RepID=A0A2V1DS41_9PLEO|nr:hypothetical protein DM02DRAFT_706338 [Periconia macrospinosa]